MAGASATPFIPALLRLPTERCLVVGGGKVAGRKVKWLLEAGAHVTAVSVAFCEDLTRMCADEDGRVVLSEEPYATRDLSNYSLAIAATDDATTNRLVYDDAQRAGIPVNVVDVPDLCTFYMPAVLRRGELTISISTEGAAPALAGRIRRELEDRYPESYSAFVAALRRARAELRRTVEDGDVRSAALRALSATGVAEELGYLDEEGMFLKLLEIARETRP